MERITKRVPLADPMAAIKANTITTTATTKESFLQTLAALARGNRIIYHTGDLQYDRYYGREHSAEEKRKAQEIGRFANFVYKMYEDRHVTLIRRRLSTPFGFEYIAVKL